MQLSELNQKFQALDIEIVTVTYDSNEDAAKFHQQRGLAFDILQDEDSDLINQLGILNPGPKPGDRVYGIPLPGIFLVDGQGTIRGKWAEVSYQDRPDPNKILAEITAAQAQDN